MDEKQLASEENRVDILTFVGIICAMRVRPEKIEDEFERGEAISMLLDVSEALNTPVEDLYLFGQVQVIGGLGQVVSTQPYLVLQKHAVLGAFTTPMGRS